jgi:hypothetical protein
MVFIEQDIAEDWDLHEPVEGWFNQMPIVMTVSSCSQKLHPACMHSCHMRVSHSGLWLRAALNKSQLDSQAFAWFCRRIAIVYEEKKQIGDHASRQRGSRRHFLPYDPTAFHSSIRSKHLLLRTCYDHCVPNNTRCTHVLIKVWKLKRVEV